MPRSFKPDKAGTLLTGSYKPKMELPVFDSSTELAFHYEVTFACFFKWCVEVCRIKYKSALLIAAELRAAHGIAADALNGPLLLNDEQIRVAKIVFACFERGEPCDLLLLKPRQIGFSTLIAAINVFMMNAMSGYNCFVLAQDQDATDIFTQETYGYMLAMADRTKIYEPLKVKKGYRLANGSRCVVKTAGSSHTAARAGRGTMNHSIHGSEVAEWASASRTALGIRNSWAGTAAKGPFLHVMETTAKGQIGPGLYFYDAWQDACLTGSKVIAHFVPYYAFPAYSIDPPASLAEAIKRHLGALKAGTTPEPADSLVSALTDDEILWLTEGISPRVGTPKVVLTPGQILWRRETIRSACHNDCNEFDQEYPKDDVTAFLSSGRPVFRGSEREQLQLMLGRVRLAGHFEIYSFKHDKPSDSDSVARWSLVEDGTGEHPLHFYYPIDPSHEFIVGCDAADGGDCFDAAVLYDRNWRCVVASWAEKRCPAIVTAGLCDCLSRAANDAYVIPERESGGIAVTQYLMDVFAVRNLHMSRAPAVQRDGSEPLNKAGFVTRPDSKALLIETFKTVLIEHRFHCPSLTIINQALGWQEDPVTGKTLKRKGYLDSLMATLLCCYAAELLGPPKGGFSDAPADPWNRVSGAVIIPAGLLSDGVPDPWHDRDTHASLAMMDAEAETDSLPAPWLLDVGEGGRDDDDDGYLHDAEPAPWES